MSDDIKKQLEWTGERYLPEVKGNIELEHLHRYLFASQAVSNKTVLDIACGEGYGSTLLAKKAKMVFGVDISSDVVSHAKNKYKRKNLSFRTGSCSNIPLDDSSVDIVVSFETIEHHDQHQEMMDEIKRVLRPEGVLIISSPDKLEYSENPNYHNEYHVKELYREEFNELLDANFKNHRIYGQKVIYGSAILQEKGSSAVVSYDLNDRKASSGVPAALYLIAVASDLKLPAVKNGILEQPVNQSEPAQNWRNLVSERDEQIEQLSETVADKDREISELNEAIANSKGEVSHLGQTIVDREKQITKLEQCISERDDQIANLSDEIVCRGEWALRLDAELEEERNRYLRVTKSNSWCATLPLREARRWFTYPQKQAKLYGKILLLRMKHFYQSLPLSYQTKAFHRNFLAKYFPKILLVSGSSLNSIPSINRHVSERFSVKSSCPNSESENNSAIVLKTSADPEVSIIIPVYGEIDYTLRCLQSIASNPPLIKYEIIVVDDCSPDDSTEVLADIKGIRVLTNKQNQGFILSCNRGAKAAKGEYLYFLNNDTEVTTGWLDELLRTFHEFPGTGLVGSKLIYPDGQLQEAGGIIWQDGSAWNYGRFQDPQLPIYNYAREVDYCSGASIMVPRELFDELGGFDEHYLPAYCEDSDLAFKVRDKGYRVIYQPFSTVIHYEGVTSGTDTSQGIKSYQVENIKKMFERWKTRLQTHQQSGEDVDSAKDRRATRRVLVLDHCTPTPNQDAGSVTVFNLLLLLREMDFQVTFIPEDNFLYMPEYTTALQRVGIEVLYAPYVTSVEKHLIEFGKRYNLAFLFRPGVVERHLATIRRLCSDAKVLFHTVDLHYLRMSREAELFSGKVKRKEADEMKQRELSAIGSVDASIVHSTVELEILRSELPDAKIHVFPLIMDIKRTDKTFSERKDIVFVGGYQHTPNIDAVQYFVTEIMPLLRQHLPGIHFFAVGSNPPEKIQSLESEDVIVTGFIEDLNQLLDKMRISVAPLRYGAGIKGKIGSAMAVGLPVVATPLAAEGMNLTDEDNILIAEDVDEFATAIIRLYQDESLWNRLSSNGLEFAETAWGAETAWSILNAILFDLSISTIRSAFPLSLFSGADGIRKDSENSHPFSRLLKNY